MTEGDLVVEIARNVGLVASIMGTVGTAIKAGQWKGEHGARLVVAEHTLTRTVEQLSKIDARVDGLERELAETLTALKKDVEYIRKTIEEEKEERRRYAQA
ncbi:MAG: hypothetical protein LBO80_12085 [Treponema sp.]|jgi:hypothetical protein|nr:hypothetical protein [Treponema sp.]